jgi:hypothetical protein
VKNKGVEKVSIALRVPGFPKHARENGIANTLKQVEPIRYHMVCLHQRFSLKIRDILITISNS